MKKQISQEINICLSTDDNYIQHTATVVASILSNAKKSDNYHFYILSSQLSDENKKKFDKLKMIKDCEIDYPIWDNKLLTPFKRVKMHAHLTLATFNRLLIPLLFPDLNKMIYIDSDLVVLSDISELDKIDITNYYFAGVKDANSKALVRKHGYDDKYDYINAGVIIINCKELRENNYFNKMLKQIGKIEAKTGDQDFINFCFHNKIKLISYKWNMYHKFHFEQYGGIQPLNDVDYVEAVKNPKIVHFVGPDKPWNCNSNHPYKKYYLKYLEMTPWKSLVNDLIPKDIFADKNLYPFDVGIISLGCNEEIQTYLTNSGVYRITEVNCMPFDNCYASLQGIVSTLQQNFANIFNDLKFNENRGYFVNENLNFFFNKDRDCLDNNGLFKKRLDMRVSNFKLAVLSSKPIFFILKANSEVNLINTLYEKIKKIRNGNPFKLVVIDQSNSLRGLKSDIIHCTICSPFDNATQWSNPQFNKTKEAILYRQNVVNYIVKEIKHLKKISKINGWVKSSSNSEKRCFFSLFNLKLFSMRMQNDVVQKKQKGIFRILGIPLFLWKKDITKTIYWFLNFRIIKIKMTLKKISFYFLGLKLFQVKKSCNQNTYYFLGVRIGKKTPNKLIFLFLSRTRSGIYSIYKLLGVPIFYRKKAYTSTAQLPENTKKLKKLKNKYKGKRCFIIGGSPSLNLLDLRKLNGEYTCTVGKGYKLVEKGLCHSTFHVFGDIFGYAESSTELDVNFSDIYFFRSAIDCINNVKHKIFFDTYERETNPAFCGCQLDITKPLYCGKTVVLYALQIMAYLGFSEIIFIGVDLNFKKIQGHVYQSTSKESQREQWSILNQKCMYDSLRFCTEYLIKHKNIKILNASPVDGMHFMEKSSFDNLFK